MRNPNRIVIIGAGAAGLTTAESLRRLGFGGTIRMVNAEHMLPYDRPPLSKQVLAGTWPPEKVLFRSPAALEKLALDWHHGVQASRLDVVGHRVELSDGQRLEFDVAVIATGVAPRSLARGQDLQGVFALRTLEDALTLRQTLAARKRLVVVGGGFLGLEAAATAHQLGLEVEVIEPLPVCLEGPLGSTIGERVMHLQTAHGVRLRNGIGVRRLIGDQEQGSSGAVTAVELQDGTILPAERVLVAIGSQPAIDWLAGSGLTLQNGIVCNAFCEAAPDIYAAGDVANWYHPRLERHVRIEEILRVTPIGEGRPRITREPIQLGETTLPAGEVLFLVLHAANHDPSVFPDARAIRFDRDMPPILSFGRGIHACLGQQIARMELQVLWQTLLTRLPTVRLAVPPSEVPWRENDTLTFGPAHLPVTW